MLICRKEFSSRKVPDKLGVGGVCGNAEIHHNLSIQSFLHLFLLWFNFWLSNWKLS